LSDPRTPRYFLSQFALNLANAQLNCFQLEELASGHGGASSPAHRIANVKGMREARLLYSILGSDVESHPRVRSLALCNLANALDESGRWVEAYSYGILPPQFLIQRSVGIRAKRHSVS
jgi:hypothetical protein